MRFVLPIEPKAKERPRVTRSGHAFTPKATKEFSDAVKALTAGLEPLDGPLEMSVIYVFSRPKSLGSRNPIRQPRPHRPDLDNLDKALLDALNGQAYKDDQQICRLTSTKVYAALDEDPCIEVELTPFISVDFSEPIARARWGSRSEAIETILDAIERGKSMIDAASAAGITDRTLYNWQREQPELKTEIERARARAESYYLECLKEAATEKKDWRAYAWLLEHDFPDRWSLKREVEVAVSQKSDGIAEVKAMIEQTTPLVIQAQRAQELDEEEDDDE